MNVLGLDFETRSRVDLKACGTDVYASDLSTDIICCSFIVKSTGQSWLWYAHEEPPSALLMAIKAADEIEAHNARFDQLIYEYIAVGDYGFPIVEKEKWVCTAAQCRVNALPASLDLATRAANAKYKKDFSGSALIRQLSIPNKKTGEFNFDPALIKKMGRYCLSDSKAMVSMTSKLRQLSDADKRDWQVNERINDKGIMVDLELAHLAQKYAADEKEELGRRLHELTDGAITSVTQTKRLLEVLKVEFKDDPELMKCIKKTNNELEVKYTLDKAARSQLLDCDILDDHYREVIDLIDQGGKSSVAKFTSMINRADPETGRVHGAFIFAGAGQTQRYSSKGLQLHNMRRDCFSATETLELKTKMQRGEKILNVMNTLAKLLRPTIMPAPKHKFVVGDWSAIEARVLPWLSDSEGGEAALDIFRTGRDVYIETAKSMNLPDRQIGKVAVLSLGFGGAVGAFQAMAKNYGLEMDNNAAQVVVNRWRKANPWAKQFWKELERATVRAVRNPTKVYTAGRVRYVYIPEILGGTLMCIMPNDTVIQYPYARIENGGVTAMKASVRPKSDSEDEWPRMSLWGGFLAENITQCASACLLRELMADLVRDEFPVVGHVHDEVILEVPDLEVDITVEELQEYMEEPPEWAHGLPLKAEPEIFERYGK